jgi:hypothetical protein
VEFSFAKDRVTQKEKLDVTYASQHLPAGSVINLQGQVGSAHAWKNVERLPISASTATRGDHNELPVAAGLLSSGVVSFRSISLVGWRARTGWNLCLLVSGQLASWWLTGNGGPTGCSTGSPTASTVSCICLAPVVWATRAGAG